MKKVLLCLALCTSLFTSAQSNLVKGSQVVSARFGGGKYSFGKFGQVDFGLAYQEKLLVRFGVSYERGLVGSTELAVGRVNVDHSFNLFDLKDRLYVNAVAGGYFGYESIESTRNPLSNTNFIFGANLGAEIDVFVTKKISMKGEFLQYYMQNSNLSPWFYTGTIGVSYVIN